VSSPSSAPSASTPNRGNGLGVTGLVFALLASGFGIYDLASWSSGLYSYVDVTEIGLLFMMSLLGIVFGAIGTAQKSRVGSWALSLSIFSLLLTFYLAQYSA
jgi:hypothetical protein